MSKYDPLWQSVKEKGSDSLQMSFDEIEQILGFPIDHSFLTFKKELAAYGYRVGRISMKQRTVSFERTDNAD